MADKPISLLFKKSDSKTMGMLRNMKADQATSVIMINAFSEKDILTGKFLRLTEEQDQIVRDFEECIKQAAEDMTKRGEDIRSFMQHLEEHERDPLDVSISHLHTNQYKEILDRMNENYMDRNKELLFIHKTYIEPMIIPAVISAPRKEKNNDNKVLEFIGNAETIANGGTTKHESKHKHTATVYSINRKNDV